MKIIILILFFVILCKANYQEHYFRAIWDCDDEGCFIASCEPGFADCNSKSIDGCEVNLNNEIYNCGECGNICFMPINGMPSCVLGICSIGLCNAPYADCNYKLLDGCEVNLATDIDNCGSCGAMCPIPINGIRNCIAGKCNIEACIAGYADCDHNINNGCETNLQTDPNNCGQCSHVCSNQCINGACEPIPITCSGIDEIECGGTCILIDINHCGSCDTKCSNQVCSGAGIGARCISTSTKYTDHGCISSMLTGTRSESEVNPYGTPYTSNDCFAKCNSAFTLTVDTSDAGINIICQCYTEVSGNPTTGCLNGHGITMDGDGSVELYTVP